MKSWAQAAKDAWWSGSVASVVSTVVLALRGHRETGHPFAPTNAIGHWFFGERAKREVRPSVRYTASGYATHHIASVFWAAFYERWFGERAQRGDVPAAVGGGIAVAALACFVDYQLTPRRLRPGYEAHLSNQALVGVYGAIALSFALASLARRAAQPDRAPLPWRAHTHRVRRPVPSFVRPRWAERDLTRRQPVL
jgi:hypothetical protein